MSLEIQRRRILANKKELPSIYQRVDYLYCNDTPCCIATQYYMTEDTDYQFNVRFKMVSAPTYSYPAVFTQRYVGENYWMWRLIGNNTSTVNFLCNAKSKAGGGSTIIGVSALGWNKAEISYRKSIVNGVEKTLLTTSGVFPSNDKQILLFGTETTTSPMVMAISYFQIYKANKLVVNLIPCYRKADNVLGYYDSARKMFLTNANSNGQFIYGNEV